ncbi:hypothetical protein CEXT_124631 [Caerostris extrusa]|uniref:MATH domain-containing protein n=1 Tax=Caerostris extrusa TaxID=172846 RepID=A0AAV4X5W9_CAEEX|nr:hypothetical protein CEXT_124631 [Caerostris extrusa]
MSAQSESILLVVKYRAPLTQAREQPTGGWTLSSAGFDWEVGVEGNFFTLCVYQSLYLQGESRDLNPQRATTDLRCKIEFFENERYIANCELRRKTAKKSCEENLSSRCLSILTVDETHASHPPYIRLHRRLFLTPV